METLEKSIILSESDFDPSVISKTVRTICANKKMFYLLGGDIQKNLYNTIDDLKEADDELAAALTQIRFAYDISFSHPTTVSEVSAGEDSPAETSVNRLSELLEKFEYDENGNLLKDYRVIIDDMINNVENEDESSNNEKSVNKEVASLFQQIVFLNLNIDIQKKSEIVKKYIKDRFRANYLKLTSEIENAKENLKSLLDRNVLSDESRPMMENVLSSLSDVSEEIQAAKERPIRIAAMGTKKAGKSVIINSLLNREYAPTSSELPTPNNVIYIPESPNSELYLEYKGNRTVFHSDEDIKDYIHKEFKYARDHTGEGSGLEDMRIHYPSDELTGYEIYDTPGPNFAGARVVGDDGSEVVNEHEKIAVECIEKADICIFVMNYSTHLTNDEVNFLEKIRDSFASNNKFYSLFIALNCIDKRYDNEEEKSIARIVDYVRDRLEKLNYHNIVIFGTSALQSFYLEKVRELLKKYKQEKENGVDPTAELSEIDSTALLKMIKYYKKDSQRTNINFIKQSLDNIEIFHRDENDNDFIPPTGAELDILSGMPQLKNYCRYIGEQKADLEIVDAVISRSDRKLIAVQNSFIITGLTELREQDLEDIKKLRQLMEDFSAKVNSILADLDSITTGDKVKAMLYDAEKHANNIEEQSYNTIGGRIGGIMNGFTLTKDDIKALGEGSTLNKFVVLGKNIDEAIAGINKETETHLRSHIAKAGTQYSKEIETKLQNSQNSIEIEAKRVDEQLEQDSDIGAMFHEQFRIPTFPTSLKKPESSQSFVSSGLNTSRLKSLAKANTSERVVSYNETIQEERQSKGWWEGIRSFFGKKYYEDKTITRYTTETDYNPTQFKTELKEKILDDVNKAIHKANREMREDQEKKIQEMFDGLIKQCRDFQKEYKDIFGNFNHNLDLALQNTEGHSEALERDIKELTELKQSIQGLFDVWNKVLKGEQEE